MTCNRGDGAYNRNIRWLVTGGRGGAYNRNNRWLVTGGLGLITGILDDL